VACRLSDQRSLVEMIQKYGIEFEDSRFHRWVLKYIPALEKAFGQRKSSVGTSRCKDKTYIRIKGTSSCRQEIFGGPFLTFEFADF
jgi:transposase-like protein